MPLGIPWRCLFDSLGFDHSSCGFERQLCQRSFVNTLQKPITYLLSDRHVFSTSLLLNQRNHCCWHFAKYSGLHLFSLHGYTVLLPTATQQVTKTQHTVNWYNHRDYNMAISSSMFTPRISKRLDKSNNPFTTFFCIRATFESKDPGWFDMTI